MSNLEIRAANAALWSALEIAARYGTQFVITIVLARLLTPEDFGLVAMLLVFISIGTLLVDSGFGAALIQRQRITQDDETTVFIFNLGAGILAAGLLLLLAPAIADFFDQPKLVALTRVMAIVLPLSALSAVPDAILTMKLDFKSRAHAEAIASLCSGVVAISLAWRGFGVWSLVYQSIVAIVIRGSLLWIYSGWRPRGQYSRTSFHVLFGFGGYLLLTGLLNTLAVRMQSLLIGKLFDARELGYYTLAQNTQQAPASLIGSLLNRVGLPLFSAISENPKKLRSAFRTSLSMAMFVFFPCMVGIALIARPLIQLLYGDRWISAAPILSILALSAALWPMHVLNIAVIGAQGRSNLLLRVEVVKQLSVILLLVVSATWGPLAVAWAVFAGSILSVAINCYYSGKLLGYGAMAQLSDQSSTFLLTAIASAIGWAVLHWSQMGLASMVAAIMSAISVYLVLALLTRSAAMKGILSMFRALHSSTGEPKP